MEIPPQDPMNGARHGAADVATLFEACPAAVVAVVAGRVVSWNAAVQVMSGISRHHAMGRSLAQVIEFRRRGDAGEFPERQWAIFGGGAALPVEVLEWSTATPQGRCAVTLLHDARPRVDSERRQQNARDRLLREVRADALTGVGNRRELEEKLELALADEGPGRVVVAVVDLDGFKPINDTYGHGLGDEVLVAIAQRLTSAVRRGDTVARTGGDEFVIVANLGRDERVHNLEGRIRGALAGPVATSAGRLHVAASIGFAVHHDGEPAEALVRRADKAMYADKARRATGVFSDRSM